MARVVPSPSRPRLRCALSLLAVLPVLLGAGSVAHEVLERWLRAWHGGEQVEARAAEAYRERLLRACASTGAEGAQRERLRLVLLDTLALAEPPAASRSGAAQAIGAGEDAAQRAALARAAGDALRADPGAHDWLTADVLPSLRQYTALQRSAALAWLLEQPRPALATALLVIARRADDPLRPAALQALAGWAATRGRNDAIDLFLVSLLTDERPGARPHPFGLLQQRILSCPAPLTREATLLLQARVAQMLQSADWRQSSRAIQLMRGMALEVRVPILLDALTLWSRRAESGGAQRTEGAKRIAGDVVAELQRISGKSIGSSPRNWIAWWVAVRQGRVTLAESEGDGAGEEERSRASFFGLRPTTDRVTFVIDHSGSMAAALGTRGRTRYEEAIDQMLRFLQASGPESRFNVVLFDSAPSRSSEELVEASPANLERARTSLLDRPPNGGTHLVPALELALCLGPDGHVDLSRFAADTIIVLCDGEITEGSAWVAPLMQRVVPETQVRIHCVLIGNDRGEALQELARHSGGDFVRVQG